MVRYLKNLTGSDVNLVDIGEIIVPASSTLFIDPIDYLKWARSEDIVTAFTDSNLSLLEDGIEIFGQDAVRIITRLFNLKLSESTVLAGQSVNELNLIGDYTVNISDGIATINFAPNTNAGKGSLLQPFFLGEGIITQDRTLTYSDTDLNPSDEVFYLVPFDCKLIGVTYSNNRYDSDCNIEVYRSLRNNDDNKTLEYTFEARDARLALKSNIINGPSFFAGDKITVDLTVQGSRPDDVVTGLYLLTTNMDGYENSESFST